MKIKKLLTAAVLLFTAVSVFAGGSTLSFDSTLLSEGKIELYKSSNPPPPPPPPPPPEYKKHDDEVSDLLSDVFAALWIYDNMMIGFDTYPYANGKYIKFYGLTEYNSSGSSSSSDDDSLADQAIEAAVSTAILGEKFWRFEADLSCTGYPSLGLLAEETRLEGFVWKFFGPVFENTVLIDTANTSGDGPAITGNLNLGAQFSLIHSNYFDWSWYLQWTHFYGNEKANGMNFGTIIRMYPVKPVIIEWRGWFQDTEIDEDDGEGIWHSHLEAGFMAGPAEIYTAWNFFNDERKNHEQYANGFSAGVKYHF